MELAALANVRRPRSPHTTPRRATARRGSCRSVETADRPNDRSGASQSRHSIMSTVCQPCGTGVTIGSNALPFHNEPSASGICWIGTKRNPALLRHAMKFTPPH
jgi:hypothetical protein